MSRSALITGTSSGLGLGFTRILLQDGYRVFGMSRRKTPIESSAHFRHQQVDLGSLETLRDALDPLLIDVKELPLVILNAGVLGEIQDLRETPMADLKRLFDVNLWSNKVILDALSRSQIKIDQILFISSGAAVNGNRGWGGYALSKAAMNMMAQLYAHEFKDSHICALAPGLVDTAMQETLCSHPKDERFPTLENLKKAKRSDNMPGPDEVAQSILQRLPQIRESKSGSFLDLRDLH